MKDDLTVNGQHERTRCMLREEYGIGAAFVRVPELSKILGLAECTIYQAMRERRFFLPHRMLLSSPAVKLDDLVDWYCRDAVESNAIPTFAPANEGRSDRDLRAEVVAKVVARMRR